MSIQGNVERALRDLDERGVVVLQDPEIDTTKIVRQPNGWDVDITVVFADGDGYGCFYFERRRQRVEETIRSWFIQLAQLESL